MRTSFPSAELSPAYTDTPAPSTIAPAPRWGANPARHTNGPLNQFVTCPPGRKTNQQLSAALVPDGDHRRNRPGALHRDQSSNFFVFRALLWWGPSFCWPIRPGAFTLLFSHPLSPGYLNLLIVARSPVDHYNLRPCLSRAISAIVPLRRSGFLYGQRFDIDRQRLGWSGLH